MKNVAFFLFLFISLLGHSQSKVVKIDNLSLKDLNNFEGYQVFDSLLKDKKYVFLGESAHSAEEYNQSKYKLIKYLNEKHGFKKVVFESGISDCFYGNNHKLTHDSLWLMTHSVYPIWWSKSLLNMLDYFIKNEIELGGIDFQNSSKYSASSSFLYELKGFDSSFISETFKWDSFLMNYTTTKRIESEKNLSTIDSLKLCKTILNKNYHFIDSVFTGKTNLSKEDLYLSRIMKNKLFFLSVCDKREKWMVLRDSVMGANIQWFCDSLYPNEKIIFWGANDHIAKVKSNFGKNYYAGSVVSDKIKKQSYYIGLYAFSGEIYSYNSGRYKMRKLSNKSLEGRIHHYFKSNNDVFLDFTITSKIDSFNWLNNLTKSYVWGNIPVEIIPAKNYDGIILINKINTIY